MKCPHCSKQITIKRTKDNWEEPTMTDNEAQIKVITYLQKQFKKGNTTSHNIGIYVGLKRQVTFKQINETIDKLEKAGSIK